jgi:Ni/Fe-hydrogenase 1 B-type cytochrome subunit
MASVGHRRRSELEAAGRPARHAIYVWERPVRIIHWVIVLTIVVLSFTGYYLQHPFLSGTGQPGHPGFTLGLIRFIHDASGFVFIAAVLARIYWAFVGNRYANWRALLPVTSGQRRDLRDMLRFYLFLRRHPPRANGHNPLAGLAYVLLYGLFLVTILTGLGLFAWVIGAPPWPTLFGWTYQVMSIPDMRLLHFLLMYAYIAFAIHHVYSSLLVDIEERNGELSSIFTGWKANVLAGEPPRDALRRERR